MTLSTEFIEKVKNYITVGSVPSEFSIPENPEFNEENADNYIYHFADKDIANKFYNEYRMFVSEMKIPLKHEMTLKSWDSGNNFFKMLDVASKNHLHNFIKKDDQCKHNVTYHSLYWIESMLSTHEYILSKGIDKEKDINIWQSEAANHQDCWNHQIREIPNYIWRELYGFDPNDYKSTPLRAKISRCRRLSMMWGMLKTKHEERHFRSWLPIPLKQKIDFMKKFDLFQNDCFPNIWWEKPAHTVFFMHSYHTDTKDTDDNPIDYNEEVNDLIDSPCTKWGGTPFLLDFCRFYAADPEKCFGIWERIPLGITFPNEKGYLQDMISSAVRKCSSFLAWHVKRQSLPC